MGLAGVGQEQGRAVAAGEAAFCGQGERGEDVPAAGPAGVHGPLGAVGHAQLDLTRRGLVLFVSHLLQRAAPLHIRLQDHRQGQRAAIAGAQHIVHCHRSSARDHLQTIFITCARRPQRSCGH
jgi:hypothetical protein